MNAIQYQGLFKAVIGKYQIRITTQRDGWVLRIVDHMSNKLYLVRDSFITCDEAKEAARVWIEQQSLVVGDNNHV